MAHWIWERCKIASDASEAVTKCKWCWQSNSLFTHVCRFLNHTGWQIALLSGTILLWRIVISCHLLRAQASASAPKAQASGAQTRRMLMPSLSPLCFQCPRKRKGVCAKLLHSDPDACDCESRLYFVGGVAKGKRPERCAQERARVACIWDSARIWVPGLSSTSTVICIMKPGWAQCDN